MAPRTRLAVAALLLGTTVCSSACTADGPDADNAAAELAAGLAGSDLTGVAFTDATTPAQAQEAYAAAVADLVDGAGLTPDVEVTDVVEDGDTASATLAWSWPVTAERAWTYESEAALTRADDGWLVEWAPGLVEPGLSDGDALAVTPLAARRGEVTGARGRTLVTDRAVVTFGVDRPRASTREAVADARGLAALVGIDPATYAERVRKAGDQAFVEAITYRKDAVPTAVSRGVGALDTVIGLLGERPLAPTKEFAAPLLGTVGDVTAEMIEEDPALRPGDQAGLSGLQARYDEQLQGTPGVLVEAVTAAGAETELLRVEPEAGEPLALTLDGDLQVAAERLLAGVGPASALVAVRPSDGAVLAAANGPGTDGYNVATYGRAAPGSTFKIVTTLALLRAGLGPASPVPCTPTVTVDGKRFTNYSDYPASALGRVPLRTALAHSCNTAFISQRDRIDDRALAGAAASLGLGVDHDLGFPAYFGSVEPSASATGAAADLIGQGTVLASPMAMAAVVASVQRGEPVVPRLLEQAEVDPPAGAAPLTAREAGTLRAMLRGVVEEGSGAALADLAGPPVLAKTGTAEFERDGRVLTHAWMVGAQGDLAVAVFVEVGESGSRTAGPLLESFLASARRAGG